MDLASYLNGVADHYMKRLYSLERQANKLEALSGYNMSDLISKFESGYTLTPPPEVEVLVDDI